MKNYEYCAYTYRHREAIKYLINKIIKDEKVKKEMLHRAEYHDLDKLVLYQFLGHEESHNYHRQTQPHHMENDLEKNYYDKLEAILDYESAGYTKPDKPLNAWDFLMKRPDKFKKDEYEDLLQICRDLGIDRSYPVTDDTEGMEYLKKFEVVTEEMITYEILHYVSRIPNNSFENFSERIKASLI